MEVRAKLQKVRNLIHYFKFLVRSEDGSLSILIVGLFLVTAITLITLTNISSVYMAKRVLTQATEASSQRGLTVLDEKMYYQGKYNAIKTLQNIFGSSEQDPGVPIDCKRGGDAAIKGLQDWISDRAELSRLNLENVEITDIGCDGYQINISTRAQVLLPFQLPFLDIKSVAISSQIATIAERANGR